MLTTNNWNDGGFIHFIKATCENLSKTRKWPYFSQIVENQKINTLSLLELLKFKKAKCLYFFDFRPFCWDMVILLLENQCAREIWAPKIWILKAPLTFISAHLFASIVTKFFFFFRMFYTNLFTFIFPTISRPRTGWIMKLLFKRSKKLTFQRKCQCWQNDATSWFERNLIKIILIGQKVVIK